MGRRIIVSVVVVVVVEGGGEEGKEERREGDGEGEMREWGEELLLLLFLGLFFFTGSCPVQWIPLYPECLWNGSCLAAGFGSGRKVRPDRVAQPQQESTV